MAGRMLVAAAVAAVVLVTLSTNAAAHPGDAVEHCMRACSDRVSAWDEEWKAVEIKVCKPFQVELPRPTVFKACRAGFTEEATTSACKAACKNWRMNCRGAPRDIIRLRHMTSSYAKCDYWTRQHPKPKMGNACLSGVEGAAMYGCQLAETSLAEGHKDSEAAKAAEPEPEPELEPEPEPEPEPERVPEPEPEPEPEQVAAAEPEAEAAPEAADDTDEAASLRGGDAASEIPMDEDEGL